MPQPGTVTAMLPAIGRPHDDAIKRDDGAEAQAHYSLEGITGGISKSRRGRRHPCRPNVAIPETVTARMTREPPRTWQYKPGASTRSTEVNQMRLVVLFMLLAITVSSVPAGATITCPAAEGYPDCHAGE